MRIQLGPVVSSRGLCSRWKAASSFSTRRRICRWYRPGMAGWFATSRGLVRAKTQAAEDQLMRGRVVLRSGRQFAL